MNRDKVGIRRCFIDSNIWLYAFIETDDTQKTVISKSLIQENEVIVSSQIINEICVNLLRRKIFTEKKVKKLINSFYQNYAVLETNADILLQGSKLRDKYNFSFWDSLIVSCALNSDCQILYSEDMQDNQKVEKILLISNPFNIVET